MLDVHRCGLCLFACKFWPAFRFAVRYHVVCIFVVATGYPRCGLCNHLVALGPEGSERPLARNGNERDLSIDIHQKVHQRRIRNCPRDHTIAAATQASWYITDQSNSRSGSCCVAKPSGRTVGARQLRGYRCEPGSARSDMSAFAVHCMARLTYLELHFLEFLVSNQSRIDEMGHADTIKCQSDKSKLLRNMIEGWQFDCWPS